VLIINGTFRRNRKSCGCLGPPALKIGSVSKSFGSLKVLKDVNLTIVGGELVSLVGPNGAGKTTLMRCLSDGRERSGGRVHANGHDIKAMLPHRIAALGLGRKFQTAGIFESLTVGECLWISASCAIDLHFGVRSKNWRCLQRLS
jgi:branched-chain amino acid transport system permease protein